MLESVLEMLICHKGQGAAGGQRGWGVPAGMPGCAAGSRAGGGEERAVGCSRIWRGRGSWDGNQKTREGLSNLKQKDDGLM